jgi:CPA2 family monovalent cation:H+ antiporter-2
MGIAADIALILVVALIGGMIAQRIGQPLIIGYITAGILVGPYTAGPTVTEIHDIEVLAEIGVALLLFALGLEFNFKKLAKVKWIAFIGTPIQIGLSMLVGWWVATLLGWNSTAALWAGGIMALSSTMVILKTLSAQGELGSLASRIMISMLIIQDLAVVPMMLILPELNQLESGMTNLLWAGLRAAIFLVAMVVVGMRVMPYLLRRISQWGSRELFLVAITALGLGIGYGTYLAGLSFAFGAFVAGMVLSESEYSHQALSDIVPLRDIFSMIFFVSVGMLINPLFLWQNAVIIVLFVLIVIVSKGLIFGVLTRLFGYRGDVPLTVALGLFQIGEFAFVLARVALDKEMLDSDQYNLVLATALVTMMMTPSMMRLRGPLSALQQRLWPDPVPFVHTEVPDSALQNHAIIVGYGRVGQYTAQLLQRLNLPFVVVESDQYRLDELQKQGVPVIYGDGASAEVLHAAGIQHARLVLIAVGSAFDVESIARRARELAPAVHIVARAAKMTQIEVLRELGIHEVVQPEFEAGLEMMRQTLLHFDVAADRIEQLSDEVRAAAYVPISSPHVQTSLLSSMAQTRIGLALHWYTMSAETPIVNVSLEQSRIREQSGVLVIAVIKNGDVQLTPSAQTVLEVGDIVAVCGTPTQRQAFEVLIKQPLSAYVLAATRE